MRPSLNPLRRTLSLLILAAACAFPVRDIQAADRYDAAVQHPGRSSADLKRDALDQPAVLLRLTGITPGMQVADVLAGEGYYSEILSYLVGPQGHVLLLNNKAWDGWSPGWSKRLAGNRLPNVEHRTVDLEHLVLPAASLDALLLIKVYHDLYWVDPDGVWPRFHTAAVLGELRRVLKPRGVVLLVDHSAKAGTGRSAAQALHRIEEDFVIREFQSQGLHRIAASGVLRRPEDPRSRSPTSRRCSARPIVLRWSSARIE